MQKESKEGLLYKYNYITYPNIKAPSNFIKQNTWIQFLFLVDWGLIKEFLKI